MTQPVDPFRCGMCEREFTDAEKDSPTALMVIGVVRKTGTRMEPVHKLCVMINVLGEETAMRLWGEATN